MFKNNFYALIIGIDNYNKPYIASLTKAKKDSIDLHDFLVNDGGYDEKNVFILTNEQVTKENIFTKINELKKKFGENDTFLFFFSGHGSNINSDFILPLYEYDEKNERTFLCNNELIDIFSDVKTKNVLFLFDTCYSGLLAKKEGEIVVANNEKQLKKLIDGDFYNSRVLVASSLPNQPSWETPKIDNGIFTHCLLSAMKGACVPQKSNRVYILDLIKYLVENVNAVAKNNSIEQDCCVKTSLLYEDFPVCCAPKGFNHETKLPTRYLNTVVDLQENNEELLKKFADGLLKRSIDSKFTYWGEKVTKKYVELLENDDYSLPKATKRLLADKIGKITEKIIECKKSLRVISLGIGDGHKDAMILKELCKKSEAPIEYWIIEFSYDMAKIGLKNIKKDLGDKNFNKITPKLFQIDFLEISLLSNMMKDEKVNLFLLLGNTLGNFPEDLLLDSIQSVMRNYDYFLIDNQIKGENKLTARECKALNNMYNTQKYKEYIYSILEIAQLQKTDGEIRTKVTDDTSPTSEILAGFNCAIVRQEFVCSKNKTVMIGNRPVKYTKDTIISVIYSRKYSKCALNALLSNYFEIIDGPYYLENKYALILCQKKQKAN